MNKDDNFADTDSDLTQIYPMPGGNREAIQAQLKTEHQKQKRLSEIAQVSGRPVNKKVTRTLADVASPLLVLVAHVSNTLDARDTTVLRRRVREEMNAFMDKTQQLGIDEKTRQDATYILCAAIDEAVLNTPWGQQSDWGVNTLLSSYFQDVEGSPDLFEKLWELGNDPIRHRQLLKLIYYVLSIGYQGKYASEADSVEKLMQIRKWVAEKILDAEVEDKQGKLALHWKGISGLGSGLKDYTSGWLFSSFAALLLAGVFTYFLMNLNISTAAVSSQLVKTQLAMPTVERPKLERAYALQKTIDENNIIKKLISEGIITVSGNKLLIPSDQLFETGSTNITNALRGSLETLAKTLKDAHYFRITGYSDNVPLGFRAKQIYGSNQGLSQRRADAVAEVIKPFLSDASRIETQGKGNSEAIADNKRASGRAKNRRVEIEIFN